MSHDACLQVIARVVESLAFLMPTGPAGRDPSPGQCVEVPWHGPDGSRGVVLIVLDQGAAEAAAVNMLGLAPGEPPTGEDCEDAVRELANVVAGNLLPTYYGPDHEFHLEAPAICPPRPLVGRPVLRLELVEGFLGVAVEGGAENSRILKAVAPPPGVRR